MPENHTTALVKATQSPALARVSNQLALTDKLLTKPEEPFLIPIQNKTNWGFGGMKVFIVPQQEMLFLENSNYCTPSVHGQPTYNICLRSINVKMRVLNNGSIFTSFKNHIDVSKQDLITILKLCNLLIEGKPIADIKKLPEGALEAHTIEGCYCGYEIVTYEEPTPQYAGQQVFVDLSKNRLYLDKDGNPVYRSNRIHLVDGIVIKNSKDDIIYNSDSDLNAFITKWENGLTEYMPGHQAIMKAVRIYEDNPGSKGSYLTKNQGKRIEMPKSIFTVTGFREMTNEEAATHSKWNQQPNMY